MRFLSTSGSGRRCTCSSAQASRFTRKAAARRVQRALPPVCRVLALRAIRPVGHAPKCPRPVRGLVEQVVPGDGAVVLAGKAPVVDVAGDRMVQVGDEAVGHRQRGDRGQIAFRHAEGHVCAPHVAPAGDDVAVPDNHAAVACARASGTVEPEVRLERTEVRGDHPGEIRGLRHRLRPCPGDRLRQPCRIEAGLGRWNFLPLTARRHIVGGACRTGGRHEPEHRRNPCGETQTLHRRLPLGRYRTPSPAVRRRPRAAARCVATSTRSSCTTLDNRGGTLPLRQQRT